MKSEEQFCNSAYTDEIDLEGSELTAFVSAVREMLAAQNWLDESELMDSPPRSTSRDWRAVTIAASARLADRLDVGIQGRTLLVASTHTNVSPIPSSNCVA